MRRFAETGAQRFVANPAAVSAAPAFWSAAVTTGKEQAQVEQAAHHGKRLVAWLTR